MAGTGLLSNILDYDELIALSAPVVSKIETHLSAQVAEIEGLKSNAERVRVNSEQQYFEIEKQLVESNSRLQSESEKAASLAEQVADLEQRYDTAAKKLRELEHSEEETLSTQLRLTRSNEQLEGEKRDLAVLLEKRAKEIEWLTEENKTLGEKVSASNAAKCEALAQLEEINSQDVMAKYRERRLEQEKEMLEKQYEWLKSELDKKSQDLVNVRKDQTSNVLEIQSQLEEKSQEVVLLQELVDSLRGEKEGQARRITDLVERLRDMTESYAQSEEQFRLELQSQKKLAELYKESSEEAEAKSDELYRATEELRRLVMEAAQSYEELEKSKAVTEEKHEVELKEKDEKISSLEQELETANALMRTARLKGLALTEDEIEALSPAAAAASKLLKSGMTLTQIYSEYTKNYDALQAEKEENSRLNQYVNEIIQEIEEKAPLLRRQREDYEVSLQTISQLTRQLDLAMLEREKTHSEADESKRKASHFQRESQKVKQLNLDLSQQVRYLLKEVEELRGGRVVREDTPSPDVSAANSSEIITARLINFKTIEELQAQNQNLLEVVRDLSERLEEEEKEATDTRTAELKSQLTSAMEEIEEFKAARTRQMEMVESIIRQRDMYRVLLGQTDNAPPLLTGKDVSTGAPTTPTSSKVIEVDQSRTEEMKTALAELKSEYETYRRERVENEKILSEQLDLQRTEASSLRVQNAKLVAQLDFATERYKILQSNAESYKKEITSQRDKNQKYTVSVMKHEMTINTLKQDLMTKQELMSRLEVENQNLRVEKDLLKNAESRLLQEKQNLLREQSSQNILMTSLQTIQNNLERAEHETKTKLGKQAEDLEREVVASRRKMETERDQHTAASRHWESQVIELRSQLDGELTRHQVTRAQLAEASNKLLTLQRELSEKEGELKAAETKLQQPGDAHGDGGQGSHIEISELMEQVKDLKTQLRQAEAETKALRSQIQKANERADHYKNIADGIEKGLKEQNEVSKQFKETLETKLREVEDQKSRLDEQMANMDKERHDLMNENIRVTEESHKLNGELRRQCASLQHELEEAIERREAAIKVEQTSREDCQAQASIAAEAQDKYQRELMLHAADVEALTALKKEMEGFTGRLEAAREESRKAVSQLEVAKSSWSEQEKLLRGECQKLEQRCTELTQQNAVLHEQMSKLSSQFVSMQQAARDSDAANTSLTSPAKGQEGEKSTEQLLEVIRFIRRQKEIAETNLEVIQKETNRLKQQNIQLERQLRETSASLAEERERSQVSVQTASQHAELMKKVENHNLLTDSNRLLREEKERYLQQLRELEIKTKSFEEQIAPLQKANRELQAQCDAAAAEKVGLQGEVDRWKNRTNHLIEQCNRADPEEQNRLIQERENLRRQISSLNETTHKLRAENSRLSAKIQSTQREVSTAKEGMLNQNQEMDKIKKDFNEEVEKLKKEVATKSAELDEKATTINQLKRIGRKYKEQAEVITKERDDTKAELAQLKQQQQQQQQANSNSADEAASAVAEKLASLEKERDELKSKLGARETELAGIKESLEKMQAELSQHNETTQKLKNEIAEHEKKQTHSRTLLQTARNRFTSQKTDLEKVTGENTNLKEKVNSLQSENDTLQSQLRAVQTSAEERVTHLEQENQRLRSSGPATPADSVDKLRRDNTELKARVQQLQKMIEAQQQEAGINPTAQRPPVKSPAERIGMGGSEASRTANIRPMATPSAGIRPATPVSSGQSATKVTASVRPMAITPATTPTATVMPTTVSSQDTHEEASTSVPTGTVQGRPAQRVAPQVDLSVSDPQPGPSERPEAPQPSEPQPSTSRVTPPADPGHPQPGKRARQESDSQDVESEPEGKKSRVSLDGGVLPTITVTDAESHTVTAMVGDTGAPEEGAKPGDGEEISEMEGQEEEQQQQDVEGEVVEEETIAVDEASDQPGEQSARTGSQQEEETEVILVESDDDDEEGEEEEEEEEIEEEEEVVESGEEEMEGEEGEEYEEEEFEEGEEEYGEEGQEMEGEEPADDDVVVVDLDDSRDGEVEAQGETTEASESQGQAAPPTTSGQRPPPQLQPIIAPTPSNRNTLAPFMFAAGQPGPYEEGDDCTVPSTPTLYVPRRGDGFAEAISSPHVPQRFVFGSGLESGQSQPEIAQLGSQGALGMDDTRMDLSQFDEGNSRPASSNSTALAAPDESTSSETAPSDSITTANLSSATDQGEATPGETGNATVLQGQEETSETAEAPTVAGEETRGESQSTDVTDTGETASEAPVEGEGEEALAERDQPSPSNPADQSQSGPTGQARPRIQRITWDEDSGQPGPPQPSPGQGPPIRQPLGRGRGGYTSPGRGGQGVMRGRPMYHPRRGTGRGFRSMRGRRGGF